MEENKGKHQYCSQQQKDDLVQLVTEDSDLLSGKLTNKFSYKDSEKKWRLIALKLNAIPGGQKDWKQWRKTWQDIKSRTKSKKACLNRYERGTGGGPPPIGKITPVEEKVLSIINPTSITGDSYVTESQIEFIYEDEDMETLPIDAFLPNYNYTKFTEVNNNMLDVTKEKKNTLLDTPNQTKKRTVAANRLITSAKSIASLANLSEERLAFEKEKFQFEQQKFEFKKHYCESKLLIMERQAKALKDLVTKFKLNA